MAIFEGCSVLLDLKGVAFKERKKLISAITDNGGSISYVVNQKCSFVVTSSVETLSSSRLKSVQKHQVPVVGMQYVWSCLEKGLLLPFTEHIIKPLTSDLGSEPLPHQGLSSKGQPQETTVIPVKQGTSLGRIGLSKVNDHDVPEFSSNFQVAKYSIFTKDHPKTWSVLELQSAKVEAGRQYRVMNSIMCETENTVVRDAHALCTSSEQTVEVYLELIKKMQTQGFIQTNTLPSEAENLASHGLQLLLLEEKLNSSTVSQEVGAFVELIWTEALGSLSSILTVPVTSISLNDVSRVEGLLLQVQKSQSEEETKTLLEEVNTLLPEWSGIKKPDSQQKLVSQKLDLCQLIRDILNINEATLGNPCPTSLGKYRALQCSIEQVPSQSQEYQTVCQLLTDKPVKIQQILRVNRGAELHMFRQEIGNIKPLLHSTGPSSIVGILSRGLLLPRVGVEQHGIQRTDVGNLGGGIYFSDSLCTSVKYSKQSVTDGFRLLLVCDVALGQCKDLCKRDTKLICAPEGYNSVHGVRRNLKTHSDFEDDEYVVYNTDQVRLKYVVQYLLPDDQVKTFAPHVNTFPDLHFFRSSDILSSYDSDGMKVYKNPLEDVTAGLLDSSGQTLPLQSVHVRCKLMDLLSQVIIFQTYTNKSSVPIEAKYVFPLEETAAVCGFEAFINGKHVIGKVKEKEQARKEYRQAVERGHGAYLMDQDAPDVFTISVGNLPPEATVLIKVTFITELVVRAGTILFSLPGSVAPWQQSAALNQRTQTTVEKVCVNELQPAGEFSLCMSIEMPYEIIGLECSHRIKIKKTDCKAVVSTLPDQTLSTDGFQLSFSLSQIHMPRMWVEKHPEKDSEACMLVFYPDFESSGVSTSAGSDVVIVLDTSESMRGEALMNARRIALKFLHSLDRSLRVNVISFGTDYKEAFPSPNVLQEAFKKAEPFIMSTPAVGGSTELWRPLRSLNLLPPSHGVRNVLLLSDGHIQNQPQTLQLVQDNVHHTRLFTCGLSPTANRYMLRALAQAGGGAYEFFDTKSKHTWAEKVSTLVKFMASPGCSSVAVKWQQFNPTAPPPVQAPSQLHALFSDSHTLIYGFVPHCTQATLFGDLSGQEIKTMVSTTELQKTKGTFLHKLTARAIIRDFEDGSLGLSEAEHEGKKAELKAYIINLSKEFSILSQFTSFVAIEERDQEQPDSGFTDVPKLIAEEDVDILPYVGWTEEEQVSTPEYQESRFFACTEDEDESISSDDDMGFGLYDDISLAKSRDSSSTSLDYEPPFVSSDENGRKMAAPHKVCLPEIRAQPIVQSRNILRSAAIRSPFAVIPQTPVEIQTGSVSGQSASVSHESSFAQRQYMAAPTPLFTSHFGSQSRSSARSFTFGRSPPVSLFGSSLSSSQRLSGFGSSLSSSLSPPDFGAFSVPVTYRAVRPSISSSHSFRASHADAPPSFFPAAAVVNEAVPYFYSPSFMSEVERSPTAPQLLVKDAHPPPAPIGLSFSVFSSASLTSDGFAEVVSTTQTMGSLFDKDSVQADYCTLEASSSLPLDLARKPCSRIRGGLVADVPRYDFAECIQEKAIGRPYRQPKRINWDELFDLQHLDGYWECTGALSKFLGLDVDFFANVFLKEKGICSLGVKAHTDILRLVATLLVLQMIRVMKLMKREVFKSLFHLFDCPEPQPARWEAVKKAVDWVCWADRQYPCVYSRLEFGWDWESCTRQLLGLDSLPPCSSLTPILQRSTGLAVM